MATVNLSTGGTYLANLLSGSAFFAFGGIIEEDITLENVHFSNGTSNWVNAPSGGDGTQMKYNNGSHSVYSTSSTRKVKKNILPLTDHISVDSILKLEGRSYKWNSNGSSDMGFIAEEVAEVNPLFANEDATDINERAILAAIVELIKDLDSRIEVLNKKKN